MVTGDMVVGKMNSSLFKPAHKKAVFINILITSHPQTHPSAPCHLPVQRKHTQIIQCEQQNYLVETGLNSPSLANILITPTFGPKVGGYAIGCHYKPGLSQVVNMWHPRLHKFEAEVKGKQERSEEGLARKDTQKWYPCNGQ